VTDTLILRELLAAEPGWVSGGAMAAKLGVSRVSVWHQMEKLRAQGFAFEAQPARGYRLSKRPLVLHAALIEAQLKIRRRGFTFSVLDEVDSTNDECARRLAAGQAAPFAVFARRQTKGRGRFGRVWHSEAHGNLYSSFAFRPRIEPERMQTFTLWMGVTICELVSKFVPVAPGVKWPNDIVFDGRKAGGMLTEARVDADQIRDLVFGFGLNVNSSPADWPSELGRRAVSLSELAGAPIDMNRFTAALIGRVLLAYERFTEGEHVDVFADLWNKYDVLRGREVTLTEGNRRRHGRVLGVDDVGSLLLRDDHGRTRGFRAGEVSVEKRAG
jgi:BirA family transcriptional regulator, biotin operon repressor / biotin---[acetyl-CoA-carboxylase] ligase